MPTITLENAAKYYKQDKNSGRGKRTEIGVIDVTLTVEQGEFVFVTGSSGAGKSTLLKLITGELKADCGTVFLDGKDLTKLLRWSGNRVKGMFGIVTQTGSHGRAPSSTAGRTGCGAGKWCCGCHPWGPRRI